MVAPSVLPGRAFDQSKRHSQLLFSWRAQDRSLITVDRLSTGTLTRASGGGLTDGRGQRTANALTDVRLVGPTADNQPRWGGSTAGVPHLLLEDTRTNLVPISNPTTGWTNSLALSTGGETIVAPDGTTVTLLTDNSTTATEAMAEVVAVASTIAIAAWYTKWNGSTFGAIHRMRLRDNTAPADRGQVVWKFGSTGAMVITSTGAGKVIVAPAHIGNNWWKTSLECTAISTGNSNVVQFTPAETANGTTGGDMFIAHVQVEDVTSTGLFASSHIPTVSAAVTRAAETLSFPYLPVPQEMTVYLKFVESGTIVEAGAACLQIGSTGSQNPRLMVIQDSVSGFYQFFVSDDAGNNQKITMGAAPALGDLVELRGVVGAGGSVNLNQSINGVAEVDGGTSAILPLSAAWAGQLLHVNSRGSANRGFTAIREIKIAPGTRTLSQMREAL